MITKGKKLKEIKHSFKPFTFHFSPFTSERGHCPDDGALGFGAAEYHLPELFQFKQMEYRQHKEPQRRDTFLLYGDVRISGSSQLYTVG